MKKFKSIFYGIYIFYFIFSAFIALNYESLVLHWDWDWISTWTGLIRFVLQMGGVGVVLFITEIIVENIHLFAKRRKIASLEKEIVDLKAKLYDQSGAQESVQKEPSSTVVQEGQSENMHLPKEE